VSPIDDVAFGLFAGCERDERPAPPRDGLRARLLADRYDVLITSPTTASETCMYEGDGSRAICP
jgi:hypothetical protein